MKALIALFLLSFAVRADVRLCEALQAQDVTAVICPETLNTLLYLTALSTDTPPGVMDLSLKTQNPATAGFRVTVAYYRTLDKSDMATFIGFLEAGKVGQYATLQIVTGRIGGVKSIQITEIPAGVAIVFGDS
ncbi:MAG TPA: hypothetical protein VNH18_06955 [Bryobacteraceae bacterium]|nr:hypothetical protein [Blastocatellia bacterium]HXJ38999.1 hypothetical protein [Bryobacteraceae bacterium]